MIELAINPDRMGKVVIVCGGRDYDDKEAVFAALDKLHKKSRIGLLIHGSARGADTLAEKWAKSREVMYLGVPAQWSLGTGRAGPLRNREMGDITKIDGLVAFPGGSGTEHMCNYAKTLNIPIWRPVNDQ